MLSHPQFTVSNRACHNSVPSRIWDLPFQVCIPHTLSSYPALSHNGARFPHLSCHITSPWQYMDEIRQPSWARSTRIQHIPRAPQPKLKGGVGSKAGSRLSKGLARVHRRAQESSIREPTLSNHVLGVVLTVRRSTDPACFPLDSGCVFRRCASAAMTRRDSLKRAPVGHGLRLPISKSVSAIAEKISRAAPWECSPMSHLQYGHSEGV